MRKLLVALLAVAFIAGVSQAANFNSIGFIDVQKVFKEYKETSKAQGELGKKEESFKKAFEESQTKLAKAEKDGKKADELEKMKKDLEEKLAPERETLLRLNAELTGKLQQDILKAVQKVEKKVGIQMVFDKQVIIDGGMDLTEMVITELNK
jgi:outer membrane protein